MKKLSRSTLRWFIGTKSLMPMVDIRRRFGIEGDDVTSVEDAQGKLYIGLPLAAAQALEELRLQGKVGYELSVDVNARVLIGAYAVWRKGWDGQHPESDREPEAAADAA